MTLYRIYICISIEFNLSETTISISIMVFKIIILHYFILKERPLWDMGNTSNFQILRLFGKDAKFSLDLWLASDMEASLIMT